MQAAVQKFSLVMPAQAGIGLSPGSIGIPATLSGVTGDRALPNEFARIADVAPRREWKRSSQALLQREPRGCHRPGGKDRCASALALAEDLMLFWPELSL
jgi:hypothetical protein